MPPQKTVFLLDDDPSARRGLARLLRTAGHDVREFASAADSLDALGPEPAGCLVLDARMPGLSGEELHAVLETRGVRLPTIVVSGDDDPETRRKAQMMEAAGFFRKPVDGPALLDAIEWILQSKAADGGSREPEPA